MKVFSPLVLFNTCNAFLCLFSTFNWRSHHLTLTLSVSCATIFYRFYTIFCAARFVKMDVTFARWKGCRNAFSRAPLSAQVLYDWSHHTRWIFANRILCLYCDSFLSLCNKACSFDWGSQIQTCYPCRWRRWLMPLLQSGLCTSSCSQSVSLWKYWNMHLWFWWSSSHFLSRTIKGTRSINDEENAVVEYIHQKYVLLNNTVVFPPSLFHDVASAGLLQMSWKIASAYHCFSLSLHLIVIIFVRHD